MILIEFADMVTPINQPPTITGIRRKYMSTTKTENKQ